MLNPCEELDRQSRKHHHRFHSSYYAVAGYITTGDETLPEVSHYEYVGGDYVLSSTFSARWLTLRIATFGIGTLYVPLASGRRRFNGQCTNPHHAISPFIVSILRMTSIRFHDAAQFGFSVGCWTMGELAAGCICPSLMVLQPFLRKLTSGQSAPRRSTEPGSRHHRYESSELGPLGWKGPSDTPLGRGSHGSEVELYSRDISTPESDGSPGATSQPVRPYIRREEDST